MAIMTRTPRDRTDDALLALLADPRRRLILRHLDAADGTTPIAELAEIPCADADTTHTERAIAIQHRHLPAFEDCGVLDRDPTGTTVEPGARFEDALALLRRLGKRHEGVVSNGR